MKKFLLIIVLVYGAAISAQKTAPITEREKKAVIDSIAVRLQQYYVFPDKAEAMGRYLKKRNSEKAYATASDYRTFIDALAKDLEQVHTDKHMRLFFDPVRATELNGARAGTPPTAAMLAERREAGSRSNYGFEKAERLPGNIGYLDFREFYSVTEESKNTVAAAMGFVANADAIIIDLRQNGGGEPEMVQYILSYFTNETPVLYNTIYERPTNKTVAYYTLAAVKGKKMPQVDVYILTSNYSFSGAEEFAYDMKNLKRATLIGETTGGGAHPTDLYSINENVVMAIPFARSVSPFTKTNWEGTGVEPDVKIEAGKAVLKAQQLALEKIATGNGNPIVKAQAAWTLASVKAQLQPVTINAAVKASYAGTYGERNISLENGDLFYQRGNGQKRKLVALAEDLFAVDGVDYFRLQMIRNKEGITEKLVGLYDNGDRQESVRTPVKSF